MNILAGLETFLYLISTLLFYPVIIGLVLLTFWMVYCLGNFLREFFERRSGHFFAVERYKQVVNRLIPGKSEAIEIELERLLQKEELELIKDLDKIRFAIRTGPALGLMGTLIPMGIALSALAQGDIPKMASNMVTAFTTTVVGLSCGVLAYLMSMIKERWVREDMREMEYWTEKFWRKRKERTEEYIVEDENGAV